MLTIRLTEKQDTVCFWSGVDPESPVLTLAFAVGHEAVSKRATLRYTYPIVDGIVTDWDDFSNVGPLLLF